MALDEVATWKFEVWNEPNIDFWVGEPKQSTYFELYDHTARAIKVRLAAAAGRRTIDRAGRVGHAVSATC